MMIEDLMAACGGSILQRRIEKSMERSDYPKSSI